MSLVQLVQNIEQWSKIGTLDLQILTNHKKLLQNAKIIPKALISNLALFLISKRLFLVSKVLLPTLIKLLTLQLPRALLLKKKKSLKTKL